MKTYIQNKQTGDIVEFTDVYLKFRVNETGSAYYDKAFKTYGSIEALNDEWEDYEPKEPLIKDEAIRKAVRAWAEANDYRFVKVGFDMVSEPDNGQVQMHFEDTGIVDESEFGIHTIEELCGDDDDVSHSGEE